MKVFTWNTQGNFQKGAKWEDVVNLMVQCDVGLIQEGGSGSENLGYLFAAYGATPGAKNTRCRNWVLSRQRGTEWYSKTLAGGYAARQAAGMILNDTLYVSWHSTSISENDSDTSELFREIINDVLNTKLAARALIGGDFNTPLPNLIRLADLATKKRARDRSDNHYAHSVFHSADPTFENEEKEVRKTLDYFVLLYGAPSVNTPHMIDVSPLPESDHHPVILTL